MVEKRFSTPNDQLRSLVVMMKWLGIWGIESDSLVLRVLYSFYSIVSRWCFPYLTTFLQTVNLFFATTTLEFVEGVSLLITFANNIYKLNVIYRKLKRTKALCAQSNKLIFRPRNWVEEKLLCDAMNEAKIHCAYYICIAVPVAISYGIVLTFAGGLKHSYSVWYPFETKNTDQINFYLTASYEVVCLWALAIWNGLTDIFLFLLIGMMYYQTRLLGYRLTQLGWAKAKYSDKEQNENFEQLLDCVRLRREINEYVVEFHELYNSIIFVQVVQSVIFLTMTTLRILTDPFGSVQFILNLFYLKVIATGVFEYCRFGNKLIFSSRKIPTEAFCSNFIAFDMRTKKALLFFMQYSQIYELSITAVGVFKFTLSFATLVAILRTSYSYITVMRSMD